MIVDSSRKLGVTPEVSNQDTEVFKSRLRSSSEDSYKVDPDNPVMKRRDNRRAKHGDTLTTWENSGRSSRVSTHDSGRRQRRMVLALSIVTGTLLAVVVGIFISRSGSLAPPAPQASTSTGPAREDSPLELQSAAEFRDKVWKVVTQFCNAQNPRELLPVIRDPERVGPLISEYYGRGGHTWYPVTVGEVLDPSEFETDKNWTAFKLPLPDFRARSMAVEETPQGFKVDWESFVAYSEISWKELREKRPKSPVLLRAIIRLTEYYNLDFPSDETHRCFQLNDEGRENVIYGYVKRGSKIEARMQELMLNALDVHAIIRVAYPAHSTANNQVEITEMVAKGWIIRDEPGLPPLPPAAAASQDPASFSPSPAAASGPEIVLPAATLMGDPEESSKLSAPPANAPAPGRTPLPSLKGP
ncbi:MAG: hypothetical protein V4726_21375 [Verrucomicrobiota bacterium]